MQPSNSMNRRKVADRPRDPAKWNEIADVVAALSIPVIANGDVFEYGDFGRIKMATGIGFSNYIIACHAMDMIIINFHHSIFLTAFSLCVAPKY